MAESVLNKLIRIDLDPQLLENYRVDPAEELAKMEPQIAVPRFEPMDISRIDTADMERMGIRMGDLEPHLKAMSYGHKSHGLIEMRPEMEPGGMRVTTKGRVWLEEQPDGSLKGGRHYYREKCDLDAPFHNVLLDDEAKRNIVETRHAGKVIDLELEPGRMTPCYVSRDKWTNELVAMPVSEFDKRASIKNADLSEGEQLDFYSGRKILLKGYTTRSGYKRDAYIQIDASESNIEFDHSGLDKRRYQEHNREVYAAKRFEQGNPLPEGPRAMFIPKRVFGVELPQEAYNQWLDALNFPEKRKDVKATYLQGLQFPGSPERADRWVKPDYEAGKIKSYRWNPDYSRKQSSSQSQAPARTPSNEPSKQTEGQPQKRQSEREVRQVAPPKPQPKKSKSVGGL